MNEVKKLVRQASNKKWWYTLRWVEEYGNKDGGFTSKEICLDSKFFEKYRECNKAATTHKKEIEKMSI